MELDLAEVLEHLQRASAVLMQAQLHMAAHAHPYGTISESPKLRRLPNIKIPPFSLFYEFYK